MGLNNVVLPSACSESMKWVWKVIIERVIEMFKLNRGYEGLVKRLKFERVDSVSYTHLDVYKRQSVVAVG